MTKDLEKLIAIGMFFIIHKLVCDFWLLLDDLKRESTFKKIGIHIFYVMCILALTGAAYLAPRIIFS